MNRSYSKIRHIQEANLLMEKRLLESRSDNLKPLISEQDVKQGAAGDQFQYKKEGGKYFYAKKAEGTNAKWVEQTKEIGIKAIATKIFGDPAPSKTQPTTKPVDPNIPTKENTPLTTPAPTKTPTPAPTKTPTPTPTPAPTNTNTTIPTKPGSLIGKSYTFEGKTCVIEYAKEIGREKGSYFILPKKEPSGCRKNSGVYNGREGYVYLNLNSSGDGGSLMSSFEYDDGNGWSYEPKYSLATIYLK